MALTILGLLAVASGGVDLPPVLLDPSGAQRAAADLAALEAAEVHLLSHDPEAALDALARDPGDPDDPRRLRLEVDARVALGHARVARARIARLEMYPDWRGHAEAARRRLVLRVWEGRAARAGLLAFAASLGLLAWGGGQALLAVHLEALVMGLATALMVAAGARSSFGLAALLGVWGGASTALVHAAAATRARRRPGPRGRVLAVTCVLLGALGAGAAILGRIGVFRVIALAS